MHPNSSTQVHPTQSPQTLAPAVRTYLVADVKCYLCGSISGAIESDRQPMPRSVLFRPAGATQSLPVLDWRQLRCERCHGPVFLDDADVITRRTEHVDWNEDRPRRGRPPKRLVEERRRQQALLDAQTQRAA